jgi:hypothetical protein
MVKRWSDRTENKLIEMDSNAQEDLKQEVKALNDLSKELYAKWSDLQV